MGNAENSSGEDRKRSAGVGNDRKKSLAQSTGIFVWVWWDVSG